jgi:UDP-glucose 4-epimerase
MLIELSIVEGEVVMAQAKTALVTGGAGFIGSHLVDRLLEDGHTVAIVDNLSTGKLKNLNHRAAFHHVDITSEAIMDTFRRVQPDLVFHLAAQTSVGASTKDPIADGETNVIGTLRLLEATRQMGVEKFVYSSTGGALYGEPASNPCPEDTKVAPLSPYGLSKYLGERYLELYSRTYHLNYTVLRYGNVYGPRQDHKGESGVVSIFAKSMLAGKQPRIFGDGGQERDFVYVDDVVDANIQAINLGGGRAFNIGTGCGASVNQIFQLLKEITNYRWKPDHGPARAGDVYRINLDCQQALRELEWSPRVSLEEGLTRTVEFFREHAPAAA